MLQLLESLENRVDLELNDNDTPEVSDLVAGAVNVLLDYLAPDVGDGEVLEVGGLCYLWCALGTTERLGEVPVDQATVGIRAAECVSLCCSVVVW